ncbi:MAG TPA: DUF805 domain-containing protein [Stellaceae bacterium]|nr:DUF805 domain-containing protein [Stellaceae bacterium]
MAALRFLFGFEGRIARGRFWIFGLALYALGSLALAATPAARGTLLHMLWLPGAVMLWLYIFSGMWGFSVAALSMAIEIFLVQHLGGRAGIWLFLVAVALCLVLGWMVIAVASKRLHDRGKSGWWLLLFIVAPLALDFASGLAASPHTGALFVAEAFALHLWSFVEMGCRPGVGGANAYGPDPRAIAATAPAAA